MLKSVNPITLALILVFIYPIIKGFVFKFSSKSLKFDIQEINKSISFIISLLLGVVYGKKLFIQHDTGVYKRLYESIPPNILEYIEGKPFIIYIFIIPAIMMIIYRIALFILNALNSITSYPLLDGIESYLRQKNSFFKSIVGGVFQFPKAISYILFVTLALNIASIFYTNDSFNKYLENSKVYNYVCKTTIIPVTNSNLAKKLPEVINNSFKIVVKESSNSTNIDNQSKRTVVYYNGVTLNEGIKSNKQIDNFAKELVSKDKTSKDKAKTLYTWVGENVEYDYDKAYKVLNNNFQVESGAIPTFETREGICFDYACLYVAMARANDIPVRLVTGQGFNGVSWVSHAWNQIYIAEEDKWINVDPTFYKGGNYFNSKRFDLDHKDANIAGEW
ncbi:transglutaminase-like putative cysteine protease [Clostridium pascui]|uniref:transglutaminase-like domain-containing protein n=1 Tax=Clostridium pascui TaxID=46609 RepID=UPI001FAF100C|nr:transglutaminase-like domain-containing protein [Clostridium pascui]MBM7870002.1 transglutaminase-like putative cysteine protease [Clostridium pascui]